MEKNKTKTILKPVDSFVEDISTCEICDMEMQSVYKYSFGIDGTQNFRKKETFFCCEECAFGLARCEKCESEFVFFNYNEKNKQVVKSCDDCNFKSVLEFLQFE